MPITIDASGTILFQQVGTDVYYSTDSSNTWIDISSNNWPVTLNNTDVSNSILTAQFVNDLSFNALNQYFIMGSNKITVDGSNTVVNINVAAYLGLIQNGTGSNGKSNITIQNIGVISTFTSAPNNGWIGRRYFGNNGTNCSVTNCYSTGNIASSAGGILGANSSGSVTNCYSTGSINGGGGILGANSSGSVTNCYSTGTINGAAYGYTGGIFGQSSTGQAINCYSSGVNIGGEAIGGVDPSYCYAGRPWRDASANTALNIASGAWTDIALSQTNIPYRLASFTTTLYDPSGGTDRVIINANTANSKLIGYNNWQIYSIADENLPENYPGITIDSTSGQLDCSASIPTGTYLISVLAQNSQNGYYFGSFTNNIVGRPARYTSGTNQIPPNQTITQLGGTAIGNTNATGVDILTLDGTAALNAYGSASVSIANAGANTSLSITDAAKVTILAGSLGSLTGNATMAKAGANMILALPNTSPAFTGTAEIGAGTLEIGDVTALGTGGVQFISSTDAAKLSVNVTQPNQNFVTPLTTLIGTNNTIENNSSYAVTTSGAFTLAASTELTVAGLSNAFILSNAAAVPSNSTLTVKGDVTLSTNFDATNFSGNLAISGYATGTNVISPLAASLKSGMTVNISSLVGLSTLTIADATQLAPAMAASIVVTDGNDNTISNTGNPLELSGSLTGNNPNSTLTLDGGSNGITVSGTMSGSATIKIAKKVTIKKTTASFTGKVSVKAGGISKLASMSEAKITSEGNATVKPIVGVGVSRSTKAINNNTYNSLTVNYGDTIDLTDTGMNITNNFTVDGSATIIDPGFANSIDVSGSLIINNNSVLTISVDSTTLAEGTFNVLTFSDLSGGATSSNFTVDLSGTTTQYTVTGNLGANSYSVSVAAINPCFPEGTPIVTNQGIIPIDKIDPSVHTIRNKKIVAISKTISPDKYLVQFEKNSLGKNIPSERTIISQNHVIYYKGLCMKAKDFINDHAGVKKIPYKGEVLYNVLLEEHDKMLVNNLICETLHPKNIAARLFKQLPNLTAEEAGEILLKLNKQFFKNRPGDTKVVIHL